MKKTMHKFLFCALAVAGFLLTGCSPQAGLQFQDGKVCYHAGGGTSDCVQLDQNHVVLMEKKGTTIDLIERTPEELFAKQPPGNPTQVLQKILTAKDHHRSVGFDPEKSKLEWEGDQLYLVDRETKERYWHTGSADAAGFLLVSSIEGRFPLFISKFSIPLCDSPEDVDAILDDSCAATNKPCRLDLRPCGTTLQGRLQNGIGGLAIVVIESAIIDPQYVFAPEKFTRSLQEWAELNHMNLTERIFRDITQVDSTDMEEKMPKPLFAADVPALAITTCFPKEEVKLRKICTLGPDVEISSCGGLITFTQDAGKDTEVSMSFYIWDCNISVVREAGQTQIWCEESCYGSIRTEAEKCPSH
jgi:hypothetical protein